MGKAQAMPYFMHQHGKIAPRHSIFISAYPTGCGRKYARTGLTESIPIIVPDFYKQAVCYVR